MPRRPRYTEQQVRDAVAAAPNLSQALTALGLRPAGGNYQTLRALIERLGISTAHFAPDGRPPGSVMRRAIALDEVLVDGSTYSRKRIKQRLYETGLKKRSCELCGQSELWNGRPMALILDHINGLPTDNRLENLRIVCPNCAATLETHCGRNNRQPGESRACLRCGARFAPARPSQRYCSRSCGLRWGPRAGRGAARHIEWPSYQQLMQDVASMPMVAVGRKHEVSDNAVRKWIRFYERQRGAEDQPRAA